MDGDGEEVLCARRETGHKLTEMTQELAEKTEEAKSTVRKEEVVRQEAEELRGRAEQIAERLKSSDQNWQLKLSWPSFTSHTARSTRARWSCRGC